MLIGKQWGTWGKLKTRWILVLHLFDSVCDFVEYTICAPNNEQCCYLNQSILMPLLGETFQAGQTLSLNLLQETTIQHASANPKDLTIVWNSTASTASTAWAFSCLDTHQRRRFVPLVELWNSWRPHLATVVGGATVRLGSMGKFHWKAKLENISDSIL